MKDVSILRAKDMASNHRPIVLHWGLPAAAMLLAIFLNHPSKTLIWLAALIWMGVACLVNARHCGRTHCYFTGPFFLVMTIPVLLHDISIYGSVPRAGSGWASRLALAAVAFGG